MRKLKSSLLLLSVILVLVACQAPAAPPQVSAPIETIVVQEDTEGERGVVRDLNVPGRLTAQTLVVGSSIAVPPGSLSWNALDLNQAPTIGVSGEATFEDAVTVDGNLVVSGTTTLTGTVATVGAVTMAGGYSSSGCTVTTAGALSCSGAVSAPVPILLKTANYPITAADAGALIGTTNAITLTLPGAAAGLNYCIFNRDGNDIKIDPADGTDTVLVLTNAGGDRLTNTTTGDSICIVAIDTTNWVALERVGTWSDGN